MYICSCLPHLLLLLQVSHIRNASRFLHAGASNGQRQQDTEDSAWWVGGLCFVTSFDAEAALTITIIALKQVCIVIVCIMCAFIHCVHMCIVYCVLCINVYMVIGVVCLMSVYKMYTCIILLCVQ